MKNVSKRTNLAKRSLPAIVAVSTGLAALPAAALELGELTVHSRLGQPLRASIAYALAPNEQLSSYCVTMRPGTSVGGLPGFGPSTIKVSNGVILLTGRTPVREPMVSAHVVVNCPYSANLSREYMLFIDPLTTAYEQPAVTQQTAAQATPTIVEPAAVEQPVAAVRAAPTIKDLAASVRYQVQPGDSLSTIAQRIKNRPMGLWPAVNAIFAANPDAFLNNDPNQLKAGTWLSIPSFDGNVTSVVSAELSADPIEATYAEAGVDSEAYEQAFVEETPPANEAVAPVEVILDDLADAVVASDDLKPGDIILDTQLQQPESAASSPNVPTAIIRPRNTSTESEASPAWMFWLGGSGLALIFGLLMFGRRLRGGSDTAPDAFLAEQPNSRFSDTESTDTENVEAVAIDFDLSDDSPTQENLALDADLDIGTGLEHNAESDVSQDFGFAATTELDIELPFEPVASVSEETDMLPPLRMHVHSILESEVLPEDDDDYDMSVIVDATKMPQPEDVTGRDLKAVEIPVDNETLIAENYSINKQVDYQVLEQDYEDEMTATQALNEEIVRAAAELTGRVRDNTEDGDETTALPLASMTELDITAQMPAQNDDISDLDDTGINEAVTVNTPANDETADMPGKTG